MRISFLILLGVLSVVLLGNKGQEDLLDVLKAEPKHFPQIDYPTDNDITVERWKLGKRLFYDPTLSRDSSISCASCHLPGFAFSDTLAFSLGVEKRVGVRNAPSLANVAYHPYLSRDGGVPSLEMQILVPVQEHLEMDFSTLEIADRMMKDSSYYNESMVAYNRYPDPYVITRALACFERTLISSNSKYDRVQLGKEEFTVEEERGHQLFTSERTQCSTCHSGFNFTNYKFETNGLRIHYSDSGRMRVTKSEIDRDKFKVPSLRNVELTGPYMHDGSIKRLEEVVGHYSEGIIEHKNLSTGIKNLYLTENERKDLVSFLKTLTDPGFCKNNLYTQ